MAFSPMPRMSNFRVLIKGSGAGYRKSGEKQSGLSKLRASDNYPVDLVLVNRIWSRGFWSAETVICAAFLGFVGWRCLRHYETKNAEEPQYSMKAATFSRE
jgi:hypothetical protein